jgi:L-asparagine transporter-like permease
MRGENFIYFATVSGFFIGVIFSILKEFDVIDFIFATIIITLLFYLVALGSVALFIKFLDIRQFIFFNKQEIDSILDSQIKELEKKEDFIFESYKFIKAIEEEELEYLRKNKK